MATVQAEAPSGPLHGDWIRTLKIWKYNESDERLLAFRWRALELGYFERIDASKHPDYPGIYIVRLFSAYHPFPGEPPSLTVSKEGVLHPCTVLVSKVIGEVAIVTSQLGYQEEGRVIVPQPAQEHPSLRTVLWHDSTRWLDEFELTQVHLGRVATLGGRGEELPVVEADSIFRSLVSGVQEI